LISRECLSEFSSERNEINYVGKLPVQSLHNYVTLLFLRQLINQNQSTMKKFLAVIVIAGALVACNNSSESASSPDSTVAPADSGQNMMMDTSNKMMDTSAPKMDTTVKMSDTTHK
jgi:hypothetical protein